METLHRLIAWISANPGSALFIAIVALGLINGALGFYAPRTSPASAFGRGLRLLGELTHGLLDLLAPTVRANSTGVRGVVLDALFGRPQQGTVKLPLLQVSAPPPWVEDRRSGGGGGKPIGETVNRSILREPVWSGALWSGAVMAIGAIIAIAFAGCAKYDMVKDTRAAVGIAATATTEASRALVRYDAAHQDAIASAVRAAGTAEAAQAARQQLAEYRQRRAVAQKSIAHCGAAVAAVAALLPLVEMGQRGQADLVIAVAALLTAADELREVLAAFGISIPGLGAVLQGKPPDPTPPPSSIPAPAPVTIGATP